MRKPIPSSRAISSSSQQSGRQRAAYIKLPARIVYPSVLEVRFASTPPAAAAGLLAATAAPAAAPAAAAAAATAAGLLPPAPTAAAAAAAAVRPAIRSILYSQRLRRLLRQVHRVCLRDSGIW